MIVLDASAVVELLTNGNSAGALRNELAKWNEPLLVPHLLDVEVTSALRKMVAGKRVTLHEAEFFFASLAMLPARRFEHTPLLPRIWELRHNFTCYDAAYIALAELTGSALFTSDVKLSQGHRARVKVFAG